MKEPLCQLFLAVKDAPDSRSYSQSEITLTAEARLEYFRSRPRSTVYGSRQGLHKLSRAPWRRNHASEARTSFGRRRRLLWLWWSLEGR